MTSHVGQLGAQDVSTLPLLAVPMAANLEGNTYPHPVPPTPIEAWGSSTYENSMQPEQGAQNFKFPWIKAVSRNFNGWRVGTYSDQLFNHFIVVPSQLNLGNLLANQDHILEIANLYFTPMEIDSVTNDVGAGISFSGLPSFPATIQPFGSLDINVLISTLGPPSISGDIVIVGAEVGGSNPQSIDIPVTGQRITLFPYDPEQFYTEELQWKTDIIESFNGLEQRIKIRLNPRQQLTMEVFATDPVVNASIRMLFFNWLPRVWGVPIWWEQSGLLAVGNPGDSTLTLNTANADYRVNGLVFIRNPLKQFEAFEITSISSNSLGIDSNLVNTYPVGSQVMPARTAYAKTQTQHQTYAPGQSKMTVQFTTLDNTNLAAWNQTMWVSYGGFPVLADINYVEDTLTEGMSRNGVVIIDNFSGTLYQSSSSDRSRPTTIKTWWTNYAVDIWPIRQLLHYLGGAQGTFWLPTNRNDMILAADIGAGQASLVINSIGYFLYGMDANGNPMVPFANIRITLRTGAVFFRTITGSTSAFGSSTETITIDSLLSSGVILKTAVARIDFMQLMRISDDRALLTHDHPGRASIVINCVGVSQ